MSINIRNSVYSITINVKHGSLNEILNWCNKNCGGDWSFMDTTTYEEMINSWCFIFHDEQDYMLFNLKWR